jgi:putative spermidine/putrescine transport system ATP-binding protein
MNGGVIEQYDTPEEIYARPKTEFVARFIGFENFIELNKSEEGYVAKDGSVFKVDIGCDKEQCLGTIRPDDISIVSSEYEGDNLIEGTVEVRTYLGKSYQYSIETALGRLVVNDASSNLYKVKDTIKIMLPSSKIVLV